MTPKFERGVINRYTILRVENAAGELVDITGRKYRMVVFDEKTSSPYFSADADAVCTVVDDVVTEAKIVLVFPAALTVGQNWKNAKFALYEWRPDGEGGALTGPHPKKSGNLTLDLWPDGVQAAPT
jgi:hypothetical protein